MNRVAEFQNPEVSLPSNAAEGGASFDQLIAELAHSRDPQEFWYEQMSKSYTRGMVAHPLEMLPPDKLPEWTPGTLEGVREVLALWKLCFDKAEAIRNHPPDQNNNDFWDTQAASFHQTLCLLTNSPLNDFQVSVRGFLQGERVYAEDITRTDIVEDLLKNQNWQGKPLLAEYLGYRIWLKHLITSDQMSSHRAGILESKGLPSPNDEFSAFAEQITPLIAEGFKAIIQEGNWNTVDKILSYLVSSNYQKPADQVFVDDALETEQLEQFAIHYINTFGYIPFIETISPLAKNNQKIKKLFESFSGREVLEVMDQLDDVYTNSLEDFLRHYESQVTQDEVDLVTEILERELGIPLSEAKVVDLAAGFGRVSKALLEAGCGQVTAIEPHPDLFQELQKLVAQFPSQAEAVQGKWDNLESLHLSRPDLGVCLGRSLPHANTWEKLIGAFSQMTKLTPHWLIDYPDPDQGEYAEKVQLIEQTLRKKGVELDKSKVIYDGPNGKFFFHRMIVSKEQLTQLGQLLGFAVEEVKVTHVAEGSIKNNYYKISVDSTFDVKKLCGDPLMKITADLHLRRSGTDFNLFVPQWGMSLGQAIIYSHVPDQKRAAAIDKVIRLNQIYGVPRVEANTDAGGVLHLEVTGPVTRD